MFRTKCFCWFELVVSCCNGSSADYSNLKNAWRSEIKSSIQKNIFAPWTESFDGYHEQQIGMNKSLSVFYVQHLFPREAEVNRFLSLPLTLTKTSRGIYTAASKNGFDAKWGNKTGNKWQYPIFHNMQNSSNCHRIVQIVADGHAHSFYGTHQQVKSAFYVIRASNAYIHPRGPVGIAAGYHLGYTGCESR